jgi:peptide/nickel transport system permease protein
MVRFILWRVVGLIVTLWAASLIMFVVVRVIPGDPVAGLIGFGTPRFVIEDIREQMGLNLPLHEQYVRYLADLARGNLGISFESRLPVGVELRQRFAASAELVLFSLLLTVPLGVALGVASAARWGSNADGWVRFLSLIGAAAPLFWVALVFQLLFFRTLGWLPADGRIDLVVGAPRQITGFFLADSLLTRNWDALASTLRHILLPGVALALNSLGLLVRQTRASVLQVMREDFIRTARAKGLQERLVLFVHALRASGIPIVTEVGLQFGIVLGATFLVEIVFSWPGLGMYAVRAIVNLDYPAVLGVAQLFTLVYIVANFLVDLSYPLLDPRITR